MQVRSRRVLRACDVAVDADCSFILPSSLLPATGPAGNSFGTGKTRKRWAWLNGAMGWAMEQWLMERGLMDQWINSGFRSLVRVDGR